MNGANWVAVIINIAVGGMAVFLGKKASRDIPAAVLRKADAEPLKESGPLQDAILPSVLNVAVLLTGFGALLLQVAWTRQLTLILGGSTYAFSAMLFVILVGIGLGSLLFEGLLSRFGHRLQYVLAASIFLLISATVIGKRSIPFLTEIVGQMVALRVDHTVNALICVGASAALELGPALMMGVLFPLFAHLSKIASDNSGAVVGRIYVYNTLGAIGGGIVAGLFLLHAVGTVGVMMLALLLFANTLWLVVSFSAVRPRRLLFGMIAACYASLAMLGGRLDPRTTDLGNFMYGPLEFGDEVETLFYAEGRACNVLVLEMDDSNRSLRVNGKVDASNAGDMAMQLGLSYFPNLLRPNARDVLVVGLGSGTTSGASLLFPNRRVECCEIEPAVYEASKFFSGVNHSPHLSDRFSIRFDDARAVIQGVRKQYDLILSEPSNPWIAGVSSLFTKEFYEAAEAKLTPDGVFAQWIQTYSFSEDSYRAVMRTVAQVFPHCALIRINNHDTILLAGNTPLTPTGDQLMAAQAIIDGTPAIRADLRRYFQTTRAPSLFIRHFLLSDPAVRSIVGAGDPEAVITDQNLRLEYDTPRMIFAETDEGQRRIFSSFAREASVEWLGDLLNALPNPERDMEAVGLAVEYLREHGATDKALRALELGWRASPEHPSLLIAKARLSDVAEWDEESVRRAVSRLLKTSLRDSNKVGVAFWNARQYRRAILVFELIVEQHPSSVTSWVNLGVNQRALGAEGQAEKSFRRALELDGLNSLAQKSLADLIESREAVAGGSPKTAR
ncbi:MAG: spermidine synthase [Limisphaerales bacterium]